MKTKADIKRALCVGSKWRTIWLGRDGTVVKQLDREVEHTNTVRVKFKDGSNLFYDSDIRAHEGKVLLFSGESLIATYEPI